MTHCKFFGKLVGQPSTADPTTMGLTFAIDDGTKVWHMKMAGSAAPNQTPQSALAALALLKCAKNDDVMIVYDDSNESIAIAVGIPAGPFGPYTTNCTPAVTTPVTATNAELPSPVTGLVWSIGVFDYNIPGSKGAWLQTNIDYKPGSDTAYFQTAILDDVVKFSALLASARYRKLHARIHFTGQIMNNVEVLLTA